MRSQACVLGAGAAGLFVAALVLGITRTGTAAEDPGSTWKPVIPADDLPRLVDQGSQSIQEAADELIANKFTPDKAGQNSKRRDENKSRGTALLIAAYAQSSMSQPGADLKQLATLRDNALKVADAVKAKNYMAAKAGAAALPSTRAGANAKTDIIPLSQPGDREEDLGAVMRLFKLRSAGGLGIETRPAAPKEDGIEMKLLSPMKRTKLDDTTLAAEGPALTDLGYQTAIIAELALAYTPPKDPKDPKKDPKQWRDWSIEMRDAAESFAAAAKARKADNLLAATKKLNATCTSCHDVFRDAD